MVVHVRSISCEVRGAGLLLAALVALPASAQRIDHEDPAFLDRWGEVRVWVDPPLRPEDMAGRFTVTRDGQVVAVKAVRAEGEPTRARVLPRTPGRVTLPGSFQSALGGTEWNPDGEETQMTEDRPGVFSLVVTLPKGQYQFKVARDGSWNENYGVGFERGGGNIPLSVLRDGTVVKFVVDFNRKTVVNSIDHPSEVTAPERAPERPKPAEPTKFHVAVLELERPFAPAHVDDAILVRHDGKTRRVYPREVLSDPAFTYSGRLGAVWAKEKTTFKVWAPVASRASVHLFPGQNGPASRVVPMRRNREGVWAVDVRGDLHGTFYQFEFESLGRRRITQDIESRAASRDSSRSMVVDLDRTDPPDWPSEPKLRHRHQTDAVLYELHVRDFTVHADSGVRRTARGKYAGMAARGTRLPGTDVPTGLDYLADLGVTDVHLLPIQNFLTSSDEEYTWGYATNLFNVPEETYSETPGDPVGVIREFKTMVREMHRAGLRVVLDVVYNHTWPPEGEGSAFWQTVPYYYFRTNDRGDVLNESGVGNALHDERPMVGKFVRDSLLYWLEEYRIDGYRFDLIGMHQPESVRDWARAMRAVRPDVVLYGEPWTGGGPTRFGKGAQRGSGVAVFNDRFRGVFRGDLDGTNAGFVMGGGGDAGLLWRAMTGWVDSGPEVGDGFTDSPTETVNYVSAHDNLTLIDRIHRVIPAADSETTQAAVRLTGAAVLLAQGLPFLEGGAQIGRTKGGNGNSYNAGDEVNGYDWSKLPAWNETNAYYRGLIDLRRRHNAFRMVDADDVRKAVKPLGPTTGRTETLAYTIDGSVSRSLYREYLVVLHGSLAPGILTLPPGEWKVLVEGRKASATPTGTASGLVTLPPLGALVLAR